MTPPTTSHKSPTKEITTNTQSANRRNEARHMTNSGTIKPQNMQTKEANVNIDIVSQMWLGFPIHKVVASQMGKEIIPYFTPTEVGLDKNYISLNAQFRNSRRRKCMCCIEGANFLATLIAVLLLH